MSRIISKKPNNLTEAEADITANKPSTTEDEETPNTVSSHLYLKPSGTLDKQVVLRRIRHRKRVNKLQTAANSLLGSIFPSKKTTEYHNNDVVTVNETARWIDDAFAAP